MIVLPLLQALFAMQPARSEMRLPQRVSMLHFLRTDVVYVRTDSPILDVPYVRIVLHCSRLVWI